MAENHGVYISEIDTAISPPVKAYAGFPICFGTSPVHRTSNPAGAVNDLKITYRWAEMVSTLGYDDDWSKWTCGELMFTQAKLYNVSPTGFVNVFDPAKHYEQSEDIIETFSQGLITLEDKDAIMESVVIVNTENTVYVRGQDYTLRRNSDERIVITLTSDGDLTDGQTVVINYHIADPSKVTNAEIVAATELVDTCYPLLGLTPGFLLAPGWSHDSEVGNVLEAKAQGINSHFNAVAVLDISTETAKTYSEAMVWKANDNFVSPFDIVCWPMVSLSGRKYHLSSHVVGIAIKTDSGVEDVPSMSPSNKELQADGACLADGTPVALGPDQAELLNGQGILTAFRMGLEGWRLWGNRTGTYPGSSDPKDAFIPIRRMFNYLGNTFTLTYWKKVDSRMGKPLIDNIVTSANIWLAGLARDGHIIGGRVIYDPDENPTTDLMNGKIVFHMYVTPPPPAQEIRLRMEFDADYLSKLAG